MLRNGNNGKLRAKSLWFALALCGGLSSPAQQSPPPADPAAITPKVELTAAERSWLQAHPVIRLGQDPKWPPFSSLNREGRLEGIDCDLMAEIGRILGVKFVPQITANWSETYAALQQGSVDVVSGIAPTPKREELLFFTKPYVDFPVAVITRTEAPFAISVNQLGECKVALPRSYVTTEKLLADYPQARVTLTNTSLEALVLVSRGRVDATIENLAAASYLIKNQGLTNLKIAGMTDYRFQLCLGVPKDRPLLFSALQKALNSVGDARMHRIVDRWISLENEGGLPWKKIWPIAMVIGAALLLLVAYFTVRQRRLRHELTYRRSVEAKLRELNEEKNYLMNMVAHDLNNPLTVIMMKCRLWSILPNSTAQTAAANLREIEANAEQMSHLIRNFLDVKAIEEGAHRIALEPMALAPLLQEVLAQQGELAKQKGVSFQTDELLPADCWILANEDAVRRVLSNLLSNALKFSPPGKNVSVQAVPTAESVEIKVQNEGAGIPLEEQPRLFGKFARLSPQPTGGEPSHGLGLAIVKQLMTAMRGEVWCQSEPGAGATFGVRFPLAKS
jgi:polar amino acid transport system substrate-binding protein